MKDFLKMTGAVIVGLLLVNVVTFIFGMALIGSLAALGEKTPVMPRSAMLKIDFNTMVLSEQSEDMDPMSLLQGGEVKSSVGILDAIRAIEAAAEDPAIQYIYMKPDMVSGGMAEIEELRKALAAFRASGKAVVSFIEQPCNSGYYLASVSDKIFMTSHPGGTNMLTGLSSTMMYYKDLLDKLGVNVQLIRHGKYKSAGEPYIRSTPSKENIDQNHALISSIWNAWTEEMAASRDMTASEFNKLLDDLKLCGPEDFLKYGLVDELVTTEELKVKLASYSNVEKFALAGQISLADYAALKVLPNFKADKSVAVLFAEGNIVTGNDLEQVAGDRFVKLISDIRENDDIKVVVFRVDSPGGSVLASDKIRDEIRLLAETKPVVASYGNYAASGGYWISAGCERIFANKSTLTGSIGVFSMIPDFSKTVKNIGKLNLYTTKTNDHADLYSLMKPFDEKELAYLQASVEEIYDTFTTVVAEGRGLDKDYVDSVAQGRVWSGVDAQRINLTDAEGTVMDAIRYAVSLVDESADLSQWNIEEYPKPLTFFETLTQTLNNETTVKVFKGTPFSYIEQAYKDLNFDEQGYMYARMPYELIIK